MKKSILFSLCLVFFTGLAMGQSFGIRAGANIANWEVDTEDDIEPDSKIGFYIGAIAKFDLASQVGLRVELNFSQYGYKNDNDQFGVLNANINYLDLPILIQYDIPIGDKLGAYVAAGPQLGYALNGSYELEEKEDINFEDEEYARLDYGLAVGGGFGFDVGGNMLFLELRYYLGLANLNDSDDDTIDASNRGIQVGLAFML